ncbi:unnamed protein product [Linum tenue]|uniref:Uncharacterized protein n=1 Tax=Linum tenue TaxID=586396 RepID=A0AAV0KIA2_9ROSI|nr:unnamed protein product [Linum tenue]CAI0421853.1 unnamed protein product [Linum tenue]
MAGEEVVPEPSMSSPSLEDRPGILIIGPSAVGKRTLLSRLLSLDLEDDPDPDSDSQLLIRGWTINTKYYSADVSVWVTHLTDGFRIENLPSRRRLAAVIMVFDATDLSSLAAVQEWVSRTDIHEYEILLCVGNKVDLVPGHPVHQEYRRRLLRRQQKLELEQCASDEFGISETEGANLLGNNVEEEEEEVVEEEDQSFQIRRSCIEWCTDRNIEYIEACASNPEFDKCLSVDGDSQGMERIFGALSAHMWPGMVLKSGNKMAEQPIPEEEDLSEESDYELEYEVLSAGSAEPWDDTRWVSASTTTSTPSEGESNAHEKHVVAGLSNGNKESSSTASNAGGVMGTHPEDGEQGYEGNLLSSSAQREESSEDDKGAVRNAEVSEANGEVEPFDFEDLEKLMFEIGNIRDGLRLMPDVQRREMAANLAMKMASMFGGGSDDEEPDGFE